MQWLHMINPVLTRSYGEKWKWRLEGVKDSPHIILPLRESKVDHTCFPREEKHKHISPFSYFNCPMSSTDKVCHAKAYQNFQELLTSEAR